jgi:hypothetical protein
VPAGVASASSTYAPAYPVSAVNNNERAGTGWGNGGGWADGTPGAFPDWVQITFNGSKTLDRVVVYSLQDLYTQPVEPTDTTTFATYGITAFTVQGWNGASWIDLATVSNNTLVKRTVTFPPTPPTASASTSPPPAAPAPTVTEIEAWTLRGTVTEQRTEQHRGEDARLEVSQRLRRSTPRVPGIDAWLCELERTHRRDRRSLRIALPATNASVHRVLERPRSGIAGSQGARRCATSSGTRWASRPPQ